MRGPLFGGVFGVLVFLPVSFRGRRAPFCRWLGLSVSVLCLAVVGSLPLPVVASLPLAVGVLAQLLRWSLPLGIWLLFVTAWPCVGFVLPSTP